MDIDALREIAQRVDILSVASYLGLTVNKAGYICCPLHYERTASCKLYEHSFYCYGCNSWGDSIDLVAAVRGCSKGEAAAELNERFDCNVDLGKRQGHRIKRKPQRQQIDVTAEQLKAMADYCFDLHRYLFHLFRNPDDLADLDDFCQRLLDNDDLRVSAPRDYYERFRNDFLRYGNAERKYYEQRGAIERSRKNGQPYPEAELRAILGRT